MLPQSKQLKTQSTAVHSKIQCIQCIAIWKKYTSYGCMIWVIMWHATCCALAWQRYDQKNISHLSALPVYPFGKRVVRAERESFPIISFGTCMSSTKNILIPIFHQLPIKLTSHCVQLGRKLKYCIKYSLCPFNPCCDNGAWSRSWKAHF